MSCFGFELDEYGNITGNQFDWKVERIFGIFILQIPCLCLVVTNTVLVVYAIRVTNRAVNRKNILIVFLVTFSFLACLLPFLILFQKSKDDFHNTPVLPQRILGFLGMVPAFVNPFIYFATNDSFRDFTVGTRKRLFSYIWSSLRQPIIRFFTAMTRRIATSLGANSRQNRAEKKMGGQNENNGINERKLEGSSEKKNNTDRQNDANTTEGKVGIFSCVENIEQLNERNEKINLEDHSHDFVDGCDNDENETDNVFVNPVSSDKNVE